MALVLAFQLRSLEVVLQENLKLPSLNTLTIDASEIREGFTPAKIYYHFPCFGRIEVKVVVLRPQRQTSGLLPICRFIPIFDQTYHSRVISKFKHVGGGIVM